MKNIMIRILAFCLIANIVQFDCVAARGGGGTTGTRPSSPSSSSPSSSSRPSYSAPKPSAPSKPSTPSYVAPKPSAPSSGWGTSKPSETVKPSAADAAVKSKFNQSGGSGTRDDYFNSSKKVEPKPSNNSNSSNSYSGSSSPSGNTSSSNSSRSYRFDSEPSYRPSYIPNTYNTFPIFYSSQYGGYGYNNGGNFFHYNGQTQSSGSSVGFIIFMVILLVVIAVVAYLWWQNRQIHNNKESNDNPPVSPTYKKPVTKAHVNPEAAKFNVVPGDFIALSDSQSLEENVKAGKGAVPFRAEVKSVLDCHEMQGRVHYTLATLIADDQELLLMVKAIDDKTDIRLYFKEGFESDTRQNIVDRGDNWLFAQPENENYSPESLKFSGDIEHKYEDGKTVKYHKKSYDVHTAGQELPKRSGMADLAVSIIEYKTNNKEEVNTELLLTEIGTHSDNGEISLYRGTALLASEVDILKQ